MPISSAVQNVGEYYSAHYLDTTFAKDTKELFKTWREAGAQSPARKLGALSDAYFKAKTIACDEPELDARFRLQFDNDAAEKDLSQWHTKILEALGYGGDLSPTVEPVEGNSSGVPILLKLSRYGQPWLAAAETAFCLAESTTGDDEGAEAPLELDIYSRQVGNSELRPCQGSWSRVISRLFSEEDAPRWLLFLAGSQVMLFDRHTFAQGRYLGFDLDDALGRKEPETLAVLAALLSRDTLCPEGESGSVLHDTLEEQSHKFAYGVSEKLQYAVRIAIEELANEWVRDRTQRQKRSQMRADPAEVQAGVPEQITAEHLRHECLVYVYRLLFCFYAEARGGELGILPINDDAYRLGYSLESLRDLESVQLSERSGEGVYFHHHLEQLFSLIYRGFHPEKEAAEEGYMRVLGTEQETLRAFTVKPLTATLFEPGSTPLLSRAEIQNKVLQKVIRYLSLSEHEKSRSVGRVNYAELGINQLGAVYEGLLSYRGMFASEKLIQVKPAGKDIEDKKTPSWFVASEREKDFKKDEIVQINGRTRYYEPGTFILHLSGIDREQSASYYTPEVLTKCLVEEALRELLKDYGPEDADKILQLKICEPAMGSGAFLNEACSQLAARYLELKTKQVLASGGEAIEPAQYPDELRRVKHYIATRNVYGVDLNPTAVELGALSLWLGTIHRLQVSPEENGRSARYQVGATPWFGLRLRAGNSLIGARRAVWTVNQLLKGSHQGKGTAVPRLLKPGEARKDDEIYHFLVFDEDMVPAHSDKLMRKHWPDECERAKKWIEKEVKVKWDRRELGQLLRLSDLIDQHWAQYGMERQAAIEETAVTASVWPTPSCREDALKSGPTLEQQEAVKAKLESSSGSFQRLKLLMDAWCALWFWPLDDTDKLPSREGWIASAELLLGRELPDKQAQAALSMRIGAVVEALIAGARGKVPNSEIIAEAVPWYQISYAVSESQPFFHWELSFPEVLSEYGEYRFELVLGNPPWVGSEWNTSTIAAELDPLLGVRAEKGAISQSIVAVLLSNDKHLELFAAQLCKVCGTATYLNSLRNYPQFEGSRTNLYKNFLVSAWNLLADSGIGGLLHLDAIFDEQKTAYVRREYYERLRAHYHFRNQLPLFKDVQTRRNFSMNIFGVRRTPPSFRSISNLLHPVTISETLSQSSARHPCPGLRTEDGTWILRGHPSRLVNIDEQCLRLFAQALLDNGDSWQNTPFMRIHAIEVMAALEKFARPGRARISHNLGSYYLGTIFNETTSKESGEIVLQRDPSFTCSSPEELVLVGSHIFVGNPLYQEAQTKCKNAKAFDPIDLLEIEPEHLPRSPYKRGLIKSSIPTLSLRRGDTDSNGSIEDKSVADFPRFIFKKMCDAAMERTLISAFIPAGGYTSIDSLQHFAIADEQRLLELCSPLQSLVYDFVVRMSGRSNLYEADIINMPIIEEPYRKLIANRSLRLNCITSFYSEFWTRCCNADIIDDCFACDARRAENQFEELWSGLSPVKWTFRSALRTDLSRRQALIEIDVLVAMGLGITIDELNTIYKVQFHVLNQYERVDEYDRNGCRLPNTTRKAPGAKELRDAREAFGDESPIQISWSIDSGKQTVTKTFYPPFTRVDREADYKEAYKVFKERLKI